MRIPSARPYIPADDLVIWQEEIAHIASTGQLILGMYTASFERQAAVAFGAPALALSSASAGLEIALRFARVAGRRVGVPANTFIAVPNAIVRAGGIPAFIDMKPNTLAMDDDAALAMIDDNALVALVIVHTAGYIDAWARRLINLARSRRVFVIEDFSHAHGSTHNGAMAGNLDSDCGVASLYASKIITAGTGGLLLTKHVELMQYAQAFRHHGARHGHDLSHIDVITGSDYLMTEVSASLATLQLRRLPEFVQRRRTIVDRYRAALSAHSRIAAIVAPGGVEPAWYKYPVLFESRETRDRVANTLTAHGIGVGALYSEPVYRRAGRWSPSRECANTENNLPRQLCLPVHMMLTNENVDAVCAVILRTLGD